jgi:hypothetical protein
MVVLTCFVICGACVHARARVCVCGEGLCVRVCVGFVMCGCVGVVVICLLVFNVFLYFFMYICLLLV